MRQTPLKLSSKVNECKPLPRGRGLQRQCAAVESRQVALKRRPGHVERAAERREGAARAASQGLTLVNFQLNLSRF